MGNPPASPGRSRAVWTETKCARRSRSNKKGGPLRAARTTNLPTRQLENLPLAPPHSYLFTQGVLIRRAEADRIYTPAAGLHASGFGTAVWYRGPSSFQSPGSLASNSSARGEQGGCRGKVTVVLDPELPVGLGAWFVVNLVPDAGLSQHIHDQCHLKTVRGAEEQFHS